ncbi:hypothetical protein ACFPIJ_09940 [Dactylosporangium cerinum]|uniref:Uncharacterized protein n=1 Tax=Dactylosporangium cerinum TaxID=1434730 RepID=A0ABV9VP39_9ACTN
MTEYSDLFDEHDHHTVLDSVPGDESTTIDQDVPHLPIYEDPDVLYDDRDGDGVADTIYRDVDHDGRIDDVIYNPTEPGTLPVIHTETGAFGEEVDGLGDAIDLDGDGDMDKVVMDPVGGRSLVLVDTDGDHDADQKYRVSTEIRDI